MYKFNVNIISTLKTQNPAFAILLVFLLFTLAGCYDMTVRITELPANTPPSDDIYISGNFNNWDPGDPAFRMTLNADSLYEVKLPKGIGEVEYKFTRGDWSTVEKDICGYEISNRVSMYGEKEVFDNRILSWNDLPKPLCPKITIFIDSLPDNTPDDATLYIAGTFNGWDPGSRLWMFTKGPDGKYYIEIPRPEGGKMEYKITRGNWWKVESDAEGRDIENRSYRGKSGEEIHIKILRWKDL